MSTTEHVTAKCPECDHELSLDGSVRLSQIVECPGCKSELEVVTTEPVMLALAPEPEEDWGE
jgi:alpha-aminoadipate/glutamate carrier protein LysW